MTYMILALIVVTLVQVAVFRYRIRALRDYVDDRMKSVNNNFYDATASLRDKIKDINKKNDNRDQAIGEVGGALVKEITKLREELNLPVEG